jgi:alanine racemase
MRPVISLEGRIVQVRSARRGETVSYGAEETLERDSRIATVSVGYADGFPRSGSGAGVPLREAVPYGMHGCIGDHVAPVLGRVTMDLTMFDVTDVPEALLADGWIELIGPNIPLDEAAAAAGTIGYELLTNLGKRYERRYLNAGN